MSKDAWGRWGADDEIGALNLIGPEQRRKAVALVAEGTVVSLAQPLGPSTPVPSHRNGLARYMTRDGADYAAGARQPGGFCFAEDAVMMPTHVGTHIDALCHVWYDDLLYNGHRASDMRSTTGAPRCDAGSLPPIVTRGVLLDFGGSSLGAGDPVTTTMLERALELAGTTLGQGDAVLIRTGWFERSEELGDRFYDGEPGIDVAAAEWLATQDVAVIGVDNYAVEAIPFADGAVFPVHQRLLRDFGIPLVEGLVLAELAATGRSEFLFGCAGLPLRGSTGSPVHPYAVL